MDGDEVDLLEEVRGALEGGEGAEPAGWRSTTAVVYRTVWAWSSGRPQEAAAIVAGRAPAGSYGELVAALRTYLSESSTAGAGTVYRRRPEAFMAYIRGGGNVELYARLGEELHALYRAHEPGALLEIGPGDGQVLAGAWPPELGAVDLVEPAAALLAAAGAALDAAAVVHHDHSTSIEAFLDAQRPGRRWPMVEATFSLQSLAPALRTQVLAQLAEPCDRLVVAEFDVPTRDDPFDPTWFLGCITRVERGLREYDTDRDMVAQGFLIPMMLGFFKTTTPSNHEQPISAWITQLHGAGFELVEPPRLLWDYWWAPAYLLHAAPRPAADRVASNVR